MIVENGRKAKLVKELVTTLQVVLLHLDEIKFFELRKKIVAAIEKATEQL